MNYPLAKLGVFETIQGEGALLGVPMTFIRLAGCPIACPQCDTDYSLGTRLSAIEIGKVVDAVRGNRTEWTWITGGEPAIYDLDELLNVLKMRGKVALATSGMRKANFDTTQVDFLSVSPHCKPSELLITQGNQINLVPGLNGLKLQDWEEFDVSQFHHAFVTPCDGKVETLAECMDFVKSHSRWRLGVQAHKMWNIA